MKATTKIFINSLIAGALVFFGAAITELQDHGFSNFAELSLGLILGFCTAVIIFLTKFQSYLVSGEKKTVVILEFL